VSEVEQPPQPKIGLYLPPVNCPAVSREEVMK